MRSKIVEKKQMKGGKSLKRQQKDKKINVENKN